MFEFERSPVISSEIVFPDFKETLESMLENIGATADIYIHEAGLAGWQRILDLIVSENWNWKYSEDAVTMPLKSAVQIFERRSDVSCYLEFVPTSAIPIDTAFFNTDLVELWFRPSDLLAQSQFDALCEAIRVMGKDLGKVVTATMENSPQFEYFRYQVDTDQFISKSDK